jgi:hypothetical protein
MILMMLPWLSACLFLTRGIFYREVKSNQKALNEPPEAFYE